MQMIHKCKIIFLVSGIPKITDILNLQFIKIICMKFSR